MTTISRRSLMENERSNCLNAYRLCAGGPIIIIIIIIIITSCARGDTICPRPLYAGRCGPDAAAQLQPIPYACGAQRALLPIAVGATNTRIRHNIPTPLQVDLWPFDLESGIRVTCDVGYMCANFGLPRPPLCGGNTRNSLESIITAMNILNQTVCFQVRKKSANFLNKKFEYFWENTAAG